MHHWLRLRLHERQGDHRRGDHWLWQHGRWRRRLQLWRRRRGHGRHGDELVPLCAGGDLAGDARRHSHLERECNMIFALY